VPLIQCPDCQSEISTEAFVCPKCGRPTAKRQQLAKKQLKKVVVLWLLLVIAFLAIWRFLNG
jgi:predicted amidophosphoribosyltransferase